MKRGLIAGAWFFAAGVFFMLAKLTPAKAQSVAPIGLTTVTTTTTGLVVTNGAQDFYLNPGDSVEMIITPIQGSTQPVQDIGPLTAPPGVQLHFSFNTTAALVQQ